MGPKPSTSFSDAWIKNKILAPRAVDDLDPEARAILVGMINTGYRLSEAACAAPDQFVLVADIPNLVIKPRQRQAIKNRNSKRIIPLVGVNLDGMRAFPTDLPTDQDNNAKLVTGVNDFSPPETQRTYGSKVSAWSR